MPGLHSLAVGAEDVRSIIDSAPLRGRVGIRTGARIVIRFGRPADAFLFFLALGRRRPDLAAALADRVEASVEDDAVTLQMPPIGWDGERNTEEYATSRR